MKVYKYSTLDHNFKKADKEGSNSGELLLFNNVTIAESFFKKLTGLIFQKEPEANEGLLLDGCNSIHTLWMRFSIDAVFLDVNGRITYLVENLKPFRLSPIIKNAVKVLELKSGTIKQKKIKIGNILKFKED